MKSAALQWAALCVCPPAILATSVATVPSVKRVVHQATRTPAKAVKHKTATRLVETAAAKGPPCDVAGAIPPSALIASIDSLPMIGTADAGSGHSLPGFLAAGGGVTPGSGTAIQVGFGPIGGGGGNGGGGDTGGDTSDGGGTGGGTTPADPTAPVPEPEAWLMMIAGFGFVGIGLRWRRARARAASGPVIGNTFRRRRHARATGGASTLIAGLGFGEVATGSASMATIAAKTMMCVCPTVAIMGATMISPPVRTAVHKATAIPARASQIAIAPVNPPCDPSLRSAETTPSGRIIDADHTSPQVAVALLASTSTGEQ